MRYFLILMALISYNLGTAQFVEDFETLIVEQDTFLNGSDQSMGFDVAGGLLFLENTFTASQGGGFWSGWSISSTTDAVTPGFLNQYSSSSGSGYDGSNAYAVAYADTKIEIKEQGEQADGYGFYANNNTFAYLSMRDGDGFSKKFGGATGDDPDFFYLSIKAYPQGLVADSTIFYLADFTSTDNADDYILNEWTYVDLSAYSNVDYFTIDFHSSDVGGFGINTPTYFCIDNFTFDGLTSLSGPEKSPELKISPNPTRGFLTIDGFSPGDDYEIYNTNAQLMSKGSLSGAAINVSDLDGAIYFVSILSSGKRYTKRFVKQ